MSNESVRSSYQNRLAGVGYDALARLVFAPVGGLDALRAAALAELDVRPDMQVLELGCGTGSVTRILVERGAEVTAVDWSEPMLRRARRRAPQARFERGEISAYVPKQLYDRVIFSFVLHELDRPARARALARARDALAAGGGVGIVDHALPARGIVPRAISAFVHAFEPTSARDWVGGAYHAELSEAGLALRSERSLAAGTALAMLWTRTG